MATRHEPSGARPQSPKTVPNPGIGPHQGPRNLPEGHDGIILDSSGRGQCPIEMRIGRML